MKLVGMLAAAASLAGGVSHYGYCPSGRTSNVVTQASVRNWFGFLQNDEVVIRGVCNAPER